MEITILVEYNNKKDEQNTKQRRNKPKKLSNQKQLDNIKDQNCMRFLQLNLRSFGSDNEETMELLIATTKNMIQIA